LRKTESSKKDSVEDSKVFVTLFSHSGGVWLTGVAKRAIEGAKARLRALGIDPEDPSSEDEDPTFKLS
jgi:hypothetical protein